MFKKITVIGFTLFLLAACGTDTANDNDGTTNETDTNTANEVETADDTNVVDERTTTTSNGGNSTTTDITNPKVSMKEAVDIFKEAYPDAQIESIELDDDAGRLHYDIDGFDSANEYEVDIDATTGEMKVDEIEADQETEEAVDFSSIIEPKEAIERASEKAEVKGLSPTGWSLEVDNGKPTYTIEYDKNGSDIDIKIDATSGEVLEVDLD